MTKFFRSLVILTFILTFALYAVDSTYEIKISMEVSQYTRDIADELLHRAKTEALKKYLHRLGATPELIRKACTDVDNFVKYARAKNTRIKGTGNKTNLLTGSVNVELNIKEIRQWLDINGFKKQGKIEIVILEEPPSLGALNLTAEVGTEAGETKEFVQNYTSFQRRVRDSLIKKMDELSFEVTLLADNEIYEEYKSKDNELLGVFFDPETNNFVINTDLLNAVRSNNPDTLVLYYRLETVEFESASKQIRVTVALGIKNLGTNITKSFGTKSVTGYSKATTTALLVDDIGLMAEKAIMALMDTEEVGNKLEVECKNVSSALKGTIKVLINTEVIDAKIRKRVMYQLKKQILAENIAIADNVVSNNTSLIFEVNPEFKDTEELYFEKILPIFEELGVEIDDEKIFYGKGTITIKP